MTTNENGRSKEEDHYQQLGRSVPEFVWDATVALVAICGKELRQHGTGTLFRIGECSFIVTAAHVIQEAKQRGIRVCVTCPEGSFLPLTGQWMCSAEAGCGTCEDRFDVAVIKLNPIERKRFQRGLFLRLSDVSFQENVQSGVFSVFGFPEIWSNSSVDDATTLNLRPLQYTTYACEGDTTTLAGYEARFHLLLNGEFIDIRDSNAQPVTFRDRSGRAARFPHELGGISGGSVWLIGDRSVPLSQWLNSTPRMVAVETGVFSQRGVIKATKWIAVRTLLYSAFPEVRPSFDLWRGV